MITAVTFALAAAAGSLARAEAGRRWNLHEGFPWGTLLVNVSGSLALGLLHDFTPPAVTVAGVGGLGAFTTFSSFARDVVALVEFKEAVLAAVYVTASSVLGVAAAWLGMQVG